MPPKKPSKKADGKRRAEETSTADTTSQTRKRARVESKIPLNPPPTPVQSAEKRVLLVNGAFDAGQLGLGDDQEKEVMRPRVHPFVLQLVTDGTMGPVGVEKVAAGGMHSLTLDSKGTIWSFGLNDSFALGRVSKPPDGQPENIPVPVSGLDDFRVTAIAASDNLSIALNETGELRAWGTFNSNDGLLGFMGHKDKAMVPTALPAFKKISISSVACGEDHALALSDAGRVYAWGNGTNFQLGRRILERRKTSGLVPEALRKLRNIVGVFAGTHTSFAVDQNGVVFAWGLNQMAQTGVGFAESPIQAPTEVEAMHPDNHGGAHVVGIAGGEHHTHFLLSNGEVWGCGRYGGCRLGLADDHPRVLEHLEEVEAAKEDADMPEDARPKPDDFLVLEPVRVAFPPPPTEDDPEPELPPYEDAVPAAATTRIRHISAGERYTLAVDENGFLYSWGEGNTSQLGLGNMSNAKTPTRVANTAAKAHRIVEASAGGTHVLLVGVKRDEPL